MIKLYVFVTQTPCRMEITINMYLHDYQQQNLNRVARIVMRSFLSRFSM